MINFKPPYNILLIFDDLIKEKSIFIDDYIGGFDQYMNNTLLHRLDQIAYDHSINLNIFYTGILTNNIKEKYKNLNIAFSLEPDYKVTWDPFKTYNIHPEINYKNFICSFNGSAHVSRKLLTAVLNRSGYFDPNTCSKNFTYSTDALDGHVLDYTNSMHQFYRKFFISDKCENFFQTVNSFGHVRYDHAQNIFNLENKLTQSFLHIVSETMATSYYPFVTEKFLYSIVTRGLFLAYAQPGWHAHLEKYYGFQKYTRLFDYRFDSIQNPVERLVELMTMISKFSVLSADDWQDLYNMETDTIEYNYNHYFSGDYLKCLAKHSQTV